MHRWKHSIKVDLKEIECGAGVDWVNLAQDGDK